MHIGEGRYGILLIRHGETLASLRGAYSGCRSDEPLSEEGRKKLDKDRLSALRAERIYTGPMLRCRQTAEILFPGRLCTVLKGMTETDFGDWEGKSYKELNGDPLYQAWIDSGGRNAFPEGEDRESFVRRTMTAFYEMLKDMGECRNAALVCHGGNIMAVMSSLAGGDYFDHQRPCGSGYELKFTTEGDRIYDLSYDSLSAGLYT